MATYRDVKVEIGGLMRCCTGTISQYAFDHVDEPIEPGLVLDCAFEVAGNRQIIVDPATLHFRWNREDEARAALAVPKEENPDA